MWVEECEFIRRGWRFEDYHEQLSQFSFKWGHKQTELLILRFRKSSVVLTQKWLVGCRKVWVETLTVNSIQYVIMVNYVFYTRTLKARNQQRNLWFQQNELLYELESLKFEHCSLIGSFLALVMYPGLPTHLIFPFVIFICGTILIICVRRKATHTGRTEGHNNKSTQKHWQISENGFKRVRENGILYYANKQFSNQKAMEYSFILYHSFPMDHLVFVFLLFLFFNFTITKINHLS